MSIGLFIGSREPQKEDRFIPIASDAVFQNHWQPICNHLGLRWVPRFQTGWMISHQDMPHILDELARIQRYLTENPPPAEFTPHILARLNVLIRELDEAHKTAAVDAIVGTPWHAQRRAAAFHRAPCTEMTRPSAPRPVAHPRIQEPLPPTGEPDIIPEPSPETLPLPVLEQAHAMPDLNYEPNGFGDVWRKALRLLPFSSPN